MSLRVHINGGELFDESTQTFIVAKAQTLQLEHSLVSLQKWESKWNKPFLGKESKTYEETIDYIKCMTLTQNVDPNIYRFVSNEVMTEINNYIDSPMTATTVTEEQKGKGRGEIVTAEIIYHWMIELNIPFECKKWHLNQLLMLIKVRNIKLQPPKKRSKRDIMSRNAALNAARRKQLNTSG